MSLHRHLLNLLERPTTSLRLRTKRNGVAADCEFDENFPPAWVRIEVDANNQPVAQYVIHELVHVVLSELVIGKFDATLEEVLILSVETYIWDFVSSSPSRLARWNKLIEKKLAESPAEPTPLAVLADRAADEQK